MCQKSPDYDRQGRTVTIPGHNKTDEKSLNITPVPYNSAYIWQSNLTKSNAKSQCCGSGSAWIRIKVKGRIRIQIQIRIKVKRRIQTRIRIIVISWIQIRIRINLQMKAKMYGM